MSHNHRYGKKSSSQGGLQQIIHLSHPQEIHLDDSPLGNAARKFCLLWQSCIYTDFQKHKKPPKALLELSYPLHVKMHSSASESPNNREAQSSTKSNNL